MSRRKSVNRIPLNMPGLIPESVLSEIQLKVDIIELISGYVPLKGFGRNHKALCPFHSEKTPSFMVSQEKQLFHCFGCGAGGNIFGFLMRYENIGFPEAVQMLAEKAGVTLPQTSGESGDSSKKKLFEVTEKAAQFFEKFLLKSSKAREAVAYLKSRGLDRRAVEMFRIGYCPAGSEAVEELRRLGIEESWMERIGLLAGQGAMRRLRFQERIIFPIFDPQGRIVGFGGRSLGDRLPKYLNSPDSDLFNKSRLLYGLHLAKRSVLEKSQAILVEGYLDVISAFCSGVENVVASMGTALNEAHARLIRRFAQDVVVAYDGDKAGLEASLRAMEIFLDQDLIVRIAVIPEGHDPDSWIRKAGRQSFEELIAKAPSMLDAKLSILLARHDISKEMGKLAVAREMLQTLGRLKSPVLKDHYLKNLSRSIGISENALRDELKGVKLGSGMASKSSAENLPKRSDLLEEDILRIFLSDERLLLQYQNQVSPEDFEEEGHKLFLESLLEKGHKIKLDQEPKIQAILSQFLMKELTFKDTKAVLEYSLRLLKLRGYGKRMKKLSRDLQEAEKCANDIGRVNVLLSEMQNLQKEIALLKKT